MPDRSLPVAMGNVPNPDWYLRVKNNLEGLATRIGDAFEAIPSPTLSDEQLEQVRQSLQAGGSKVLNVTALPGILQSAQSSTVFGTHAQRLAINPRQARGVFFVETDRNQALYYSNGAAWVLITAIGYGSFESRWADLGANDSGALWIETGRNSISSIAPVPVYRWNSSSWLFEEGQFYRNQNQLATLAATFGSADTGAPVNVTDYQHQLAWNSSGFEWGPGDSGDAGMGPVLFEADPSPGTGWHLYNGANTSYLQSNGNIQTITLPNLTGNNSNQAVLEAGGVNGNSTATLASGNNVNTLVRRPWFRQ